MTALRGSCLCGGVRFEVTGRYSPIGLCHCSKCRKASATGALAEFVTATSSFRFTEGEALVTRYTTDSGYSNAFCSRCGSNLPKPHRNGKIYWVPAALIDNDPGLRVGVHIYVDSKAAWDEIGGDAVQYPEDMPNRPA